jgi:hypothetical protein
MSPAELAPEVEQLARLCTGACQLPHTLLALTQRQLDLIVLGPEPGPPGGLNNECAEPLRWLVSQPAQLLVLGLRASQPPEADEQAATHWDRCDCWPLSMVCCALHCNGTAEACTACRRSARPLVDLDVCCLFTPALLTHSMLQALRSLPA